MVKCTLTSAVPDALHALALLPLVTGAGLAPAVADRLSAAATSTASSMTRRFIASSLGGLRALHRGGTLICEREALSVAKERRLTRRDPVVRDRRATMRAIPCLGA